MFEDGMCTHAFPMPVELLIFRAPSHPDAITQQSCAYDMPIVLITTAVNKSEIYRIVWNLQILYAYLLCVPVITILTGHRALNCLKAI